MKAAIQWVVILGLAYRAHFEARHRSLRSVVRNAARDREAWAAIGAIQKRIAIAAVRWIEQFPKAVPASRCVRGNARAYLAVDFAGDNSEAGFTLRIQRSLINGIDTGERRRFGSQPSQECLDPIETTLHFDRHSIGIVPNKSGEILLL